MSFPNLSALTPDAMAADRRVQVAYARAWEAVVETHRMEAASFVEALAPLVSVDEALAAYFREAPVPLALRDAVAVVGQHDAVSPYMDAVGVTAKSAVSVDS